MSAEARHEESVQQAVEEIQRQLTAIDFDEANGRVVYCLGRDEAYALTWDEIEKEGPIAIMLWTLMHQTKAIHQYSAKTAKILHLQAQLDTIRREEHKKATDPEAIGALVGQMLKGMGVPFPGVAPKE